MSVRQRQRLFYLPDLSRMEVAALLHESVVKEVKPGMGGTGPDRGAHRSGTRRARRLDLSTARSENRINDVKYFVGVVKLDTHPEGAAARYDGRGRDPHPPAGPTFWRSPARR